MVNEQGSKNSVGNRDDENSQRIRSGIESQDDLTLEGRENQNPPFERSSTNRTCLDQCSLRLMNKREGKRVRLRGGSRERNRKREEDKTINGTESYWKSYTMASDGYLRGARGRYSMAPERLW